jgi:hypothetical protein
VPSTAGIERLEPERELVRVGVEWIVDCSRRFWHDFSTQR